MCTCEVRLAPKPSPDREGLDFSYSASMHPRRPDATNAFSRTRSFKLLLAHRLPYKADADLPAFTYIIEYRNNRAPFHNSDTCHPSPSQRIPSFLIVGYIWGLWSSATFHCPSHRLSSLYDQKRDDHDRLFALRLHRTSTKASIFAEWTTSSAPSVMGDELCNVADTI